ncbi:sodium:proton antiporter [Malassezia pachydermatis]|uniref:Na+ h+-exchanging protein n=1 Tax=Malassezia pachydermatis TaxID=77020 RepID=A0A0N0RSS1_9BASI|nr:na+ h+-exchanging protein [Malassezia pachydermatis]KOS16495.1 na+ h+-exchanging protein [Malassezia pachydermatis]
MIEVVETELSQMSKGFAIMGGFVVIYGLFSYFVRERLYISEPMLAVAIGVIVGPHVLNWVDPFSWAEPETVNEVTYQVSRIVIAVQVLFTGIALPEKYLWKQWKSLSVLLILIMTTAWFVTALLVWGLIKDLTFLEALCISSCVTPTDPVLANSITSGRFAEEHVEEHVRHIILAESGANDGLGFPFLFMAVLLLARTHVDSGESVGQEIWRWFYGIIVYDILLSCAYGALLGYIARKVLRWAATHNLIDMSNFFSYGFGLALFTVGTAGLFGTDDILACFVAGNSFTWDDWFRLRLEENDFQEIIDMLLNAAVFMYIGMIIPWQDYSNEEIGINGWRIVLLGIAVILLRRPPWVMLMYKIIPVLKSFNESIFVGWFGPIGVGAVYYIEVALRAVPDDHTREHLRRVITPVVLFCVFSSVLTHGVTIPLIYFGPHVVRHTRTFTMASTQSETRRPLSILTRIFSRNSADVELREMDDYPNEPRPLNTRMHHHSPFSRSDHGVQPPDYQMHPRLHSHRASTQLGEVDEKKPPSPPPDSIPVAMPLPPPVVVCPAHLR